MKRILILFLACITLILSMPLTALCAETQKSKVEYIDLSKTSIEDDFKSVDLSEYVKDTSEERIEVISFVEQGYTEIGDFSNYGLYLYLYNPVAKQIKTMGNGVEFVESIDYKNIWGTNGTKCSMTLIDSTDDNLISKFKIDVSSDFLASLSKNERKYNIVGVEINYNGITDLKDFCVGGTYTYTGFEKYYVDDVSTLKCSVSTFEVIELDVKYTTFRNTSGLGTSWQNQLTSIYFGIPKRLLEAYNNELYGIDIQYEKYYTKPVIVTNDKDYFDAMKPYECKILNFDSESGIYFSDDVPFGASSHKYTYASQGIGAYSYYYVVNERFLGTVDSSKNTCYYDDRIPLLIYHDGEIDENMFVSQDIVRNTFENCYTQAFADKFFTLNQDRRYKDFSSYGDKGVGLYYNSILFESYLLNDLGEKGYRFYSDGVANSALVKKSITFDDEKYNMTSFTEERGWWQSFINFGFVRPKNDKSFLDIEPIEKIDSSNIFGMDNEAISKKYCVDIAEVGKLKSDVLDDKINGKETYIFRIDQDLYKSEEVKSDGEKIGFYVQESVYMGLDVINLLFLNEDGKVVSVPVVSDPQNVIGGYNPPVSEQDPDDLKVAADKFKELLEYANKMFMLIMGIIALIVFVYICLKLFGFISSTAGNSIKTLTSSNSKKPKFKRKK